MKYPSGVVEYNLNVEEGIIKEISIYGDFFGEKDIKELESILVGVKHSMFELENSLKDTQVDKYIKGLSQAEFLEGLLDINTNTGGI